MITRQHRLACALFACAAGAQAQQTALEQQRSAVLQQRAAVQRQRDAVAAMRAAAQAQRSTAAVRTGMAGMPAEFLPEITWNTDPPCAPMAASVLDPIVENAAREQNVETSLLRAVIERESGYRPCAISSRGARGLMQLMPATMAKFGVKDAFDPAANVHAGAAFLRQLLSRYGGNLALALGAYNAGPENVTANGALPDFPETRDYVRSILKRVSPED